MLCRSGNFRRLLFDQLPYGVAAGVGIQLLPFLQCTRELAIRYSGHKREPAVECSLGFSPHVFNQPGDIPFISSRKRPSSQVEPDFSPLFATNLIVIEVAV